ncbi:4Fe-4S dicluster domain-containing protein [Eggerthella lenta]|uniref:4Fe-4S dicluster domain-containing protein n=1 Tax=Eggerthella lenta TaxID=84112 RepID=UPI000DF6C094|nr:4Fe-4S dicluster domain-containing protein [Eggerthella lenta]RDB72644.1 4Fe-4S ferredoxin [Eggerthella lenta]
MTQYAIITDLNRCVGCLACTVACKAVNNVPVGAFWIKTLRVGPNPIEGGSGDWPDVEMYFLPIQCQHCADPECVKVCPTGASHKAADGTVQIDKSKCIGCQFCAMSCPYNVRYLNEEERVVEKCTLCEQKIAQGELPQCVAQCGSRARFFGDLEQGVDGFEAPAPPQALSCDYAEMQQTRVTLKEYVEPYTEDEIHRLPDVVNGPELMYLLRSDRKWRG